uniref:AMP-binding enzyme n=1 Tax=Saccharopolyspora galaxeae TaxID=2781241 RepID=UPI0035B237F2
MLRLRTPQLHPDHPGPLRIELPGRAGLTIDSGGEKIFAEEVERAVAAHPAVHDVVVVGKPSPRRGGEVVALVQLAPARPPTPSRARSAATTSRATSSPRSSCACRKSCARPRGRPTTGGSRGGRFARGRYRLRRAHPRSARTAIGPLTSTGPAP